MQIEEFQGLKADHQRQSDQSSQPLPGRGAQQENGDPSSFPRSPDTSTCDANNADLLMDEMMKMREEAQSPFPTFTSKNAPKLSVEDLHLNDDVVGNLNELSAFKVITMISAHPGNQG